MKRQFNNARSAGLDTPMSRAQMLRLAAAIPIGGSLASFLAACGDDGAAAAGGDAIVIGAPNPQTGPFANAGTNSVNGVTLAIEDINAAGGVKALDGRQLKIAAADTTSDASKASTAVRHVIENEGAVAIVGCFLSSLSLPGSTVAERARIPMLTQSYTDQLTERGYKFLFQLPPKASVFGPANIDYVDQLVKSTGADVKRIGITVGNDAYEVEAAKFLRTELTKRGYEVPVYQLFTPGLTDASPIANKTKSSNLDLLFFGGGMNDAVLITRTLRSIGIDIPLVATGGGIVSDPAFGKALGDLANGVLGLQAWNYDLPYEGVKDVDTRYRERFDAVFMPQEAGESYVAAWVIKEAIERAGSAEPARIREALVAGEPFTGPAGAMPGGEVVFNESGLNDKSFPIMIEWQEGAPHTVLPEEVKSRDAVVGDAAGA